MTAHDGDQTLDENDELEMLLAQMVFAIFFGLEQHLANGRHQHNAVPVHPLDGFDIRQRTETIDHTADIAWTFAVVHESLRRVQVGLSKDGTRSGGGRGRGGAPLLLAFWSWSAGGRERRLRPFAR